MVGGDDTLDNIDFGIEILRKHKDELPFDTEEKKDRYIGHFKRLISRDKEDRRLASQIAVDASKTFVQIAVAVFVAIGGFIQFAFKNGWQSCSIVCLVISGILTFVSLCSGFIVISKSYKRGDGRIEPNQIAWSTEYLKDSINVQAMTGVLAILAFAVAIALSNPVVSVSPQTMTITLPDKASKTISPLAPIKVEGQWSTMSIQQKGNFTFQLEPVPLNETRSFMLEIK